MFGYNQWNTLTQGFLYFHTRLHLKCLLMSFLKVDKKTSKSFPSFIRCMLRIELYWAVVKRKATNCFVPLVKPKQNGYASGISLRECFLMTRPPIWRDSWIKRTEKWAFLCCQLEAARQNRVPPTWPSEANLLLSYEICWLCRLSRSDIYCWSSWLWIFCWIPRIQEHRGPIRLSCSSLCGWKK